VKINSFSDSDIIAFSDLFFYSEVTILVEKVTFTVSKITLLVQKTTVVLT